MGAEELLDAILVAVVVDVEEMRALAIPAGEHADVGRGRAEQVVAVLVVERRVASNLSARADGGDHVGHQGRHERSLSRLRILDV